ncbi:MAG: TatD family nuclease-associated radical SAM protein [Acidiferrobacteraceae bacterium]
MDALSSRRRAPIIYAIRGRLYINLTSRCWLRCGFCPKFDGRWEIDGASLRLARREEPSVVEVLAAIDAAGPCHEVVFCGFGEPTLRLDAVLVLGRTLRRRHLQVRLNTDGLASLRHRRDVTPDLAGAIDTVSISLNAQDEETYTRHCLPPGPGAYPALLDFAARAVRHVPTVTLSAIEGLDGVDVAACRHIAATIGAGFRTRLLDRVG